MFLVAIWAVYLNETYVCTFINYKHFYENAFQIKQK